jgi:hypothetical protein
LDRAIRNELHPYFQDELFTFSTAVSTDRTSEIRPTEQLSYQQHPILDERDENAQIASFDGTLTWQITDIIEKRSNYQVDILKTFFLSFFSECSTTTTTIFYQFTTILFISLRL